MSNEVVMLTRQECEQENQTPSSRTISDRNAKGYNGDNLDGRSFYELFSTTGNCATKDPSDENKGT